jgi:hypothetical protein
MRLLPGLWVFEVRVKREDRIEKTEDRIEKTEAASQAETRTDFLLYSDFCFLTSDLRRFHGY